MEPKYRSGKAWPSNNPFQVRRGVSFCSNTRYIFFSRYPRLIRLRGATVPRIERRDEVKKKKKVIAQVWDERKQKIQYHPCTHCNRLRSIISGFPTVSL